MSSNPRNVNLHPADHNPRTLQNTTYDVIVIVIVIGSGTVDRALPVRTASAGLSTIYVEGEPLGGDCPF